MSPGIRKYGRDFKAVAEIVGNKTENNVRNFFVNYRRRFNLDDVLQEYDAEHGIMAEESEDKVRIHFLKISYVLIFVK